MNIDIDAYYRKYGPMVYRRCMFLLRDEDSALDAMQDVFVNLIKHKDRLNALGPSSLLYTMATNHCLNLMSRNKKKAIAVDDDFLASFSSSEKMAEQVDAKLIIEEIFSVEDEKTRTIAFLHYLEGLTLQATADQVGMSMSGIRKRLRQLQARAKIFKELGDENQ